ANRRSQLTYRPERLAPHSVSTPLQQTPRISLEPLQIGLRQRPNRQDPRAARQDVNLIHAAPTLRKQQPIFSQLAPFEPDIVLSKPCTLLDQHNKQSAPPSHFAPHRDRQGVEKLPAAPEDQ